MNITSPDLNLKKIVANPKMQRDDFVALLNHQITFSISSAIYALRYERKYSDCPEMKAGFNQEKRGHIRQAKQCVKILRGTWGGYLQ